MKLAPDPFFRPERHESRKTNVSSTSSREISMLRTRMVYLLAVFGALSMFAGGTSVAQEPVVPSQPGSNAKPGIASLKICLRLPDDTPFVGAVNVRVMPSEGYELVGAPGDAQGDFLYSDVTPGKYIVEVAAPGYLAARLSTQVEPGHRQRSMIVVMKPRLVPTEVPANAKAEPTTGEITRPPEASVQRDFWRPHELEENIPSVDASVRCPTPEVLQGAGQRMGEFVSSLEKFTATESIEHYTFNHAGERKGPETRKFEYVVVVTQSRDTKLSVEEFRNGSTELEQFPAHIATQGLPAIALIFHPLLASDFDFRCEGLGQSGGREAWQVHFVQRADRPVRIRSYYVAAHIYPVHLEGRVWIDLGTNQIVRLESELVDPISEIDLKSEHLTIEYEPVKFRSTGQQIWLPHLAELYVDRQGKRYFRRHTFRDFKLFNVDTAQSFQAPESCYSFTNSSERDVRGEFRVMPSQGMNQEAVVLRFTVPAHGRVFKLVGPGADVNLPVAAVESATFVHNGEAGSVKVNALLVKDSTLDVIPETPLVEKP
jgi:hypothetical protein